MKAIFAIIGVGLLSFGCVSRQEETISSSLLSGIPKEEIIGKRLQQEPIPLPATTPFDSDAINQEAYLSGFRKAWNYVVSGYFLHATIETSMPRGLEEPWKAGWKDGYKIGSYRWLQESKKLQEKNASGLNLNSSP